MNAESISFPLWEQIVMRRLGLADRDDMRSMREELLAENIDWAKIGQRIMLTEAAVEKLAAHLRVLPMRVAAFQLAQNANGHSESNSSEKTRPAATPEAPTPLKSTLEKNAAAVSRLLVLPQRALNPHILICRHPDSDPNDRGAWVNVRVKTAINFRPLPAETGEILARHLEGRLWEFVGNPRSQNNDVPRCPRWPGRW